MTRTSLRSSVEEAFCDGASDPFAETYLALILERWEAVQAAARRAGTGLVVLVVVFLLLASAKGGATFDLGPLKITSTTTILVWIPALVSFLGLEVVTLQTGCWRYQALVAVLMAKLHPAVEAAKLHHALGPSTIPLWGLPDWDAIGSVDESGLTKVRRMISALLAAAFLVAWIGLFGVTYDWLDAHIAAADGVLLISAAVTGVNVLRGVLLVLDEFRTGILDSISPTATSERPA